MAEQDDRDYRIQWLEEQVRLLRGTIDGLEGIVAGLNYELRVRDIRIEELQKENAALLKRLEEQAPPPPPGPPPFVKASVKPGRRKRPGRKAGHAGAFRPPPPRIDRTVEVPLPRQRRKPGRCKRPPACCPHCRAALRAVKRHKQVVEDLVPATVRVTCYHTASGYCPHCKRRVESRAPGQPPRAGLKGRGQLGLDALAAAALLRVENRLPFRQVAGLLSDVAGLRVCAGALARQLQRAARWLGGEYRQIQSRLRRGRAAYADETGHRNAGRNGWLWTVGDGDRHTFYHVGPSRSGKVIQGLLGESFGGTLGCDFYGGYDAMRCRKQRCNTHLLRELHDTAQRSPAFAAHPFARRCKRLVQDLLKLKRRWAELDDAAYTRKACRLEDRLEALATAFADDADPDVKRLAARLARYGKELTTFLWDPHVEGTNNAAERALRPAVVFRKITGGSRSTAGAQAWATVASICRTARQQGRDVLATLKALIERSWSGQEPGFLSSG
jgi:transposase